MKKHTHEGERSSYSLGFSLQKNEKNQDHFGFWIILKSFQFRLQTFSLSAESASQKLSSLTRPSLGHQNPTNTWLQMITTSG